MPNNLIVSECPSQDPAVQMLWETVYGPSAGRSPVPPGPNSSVASNPVPSEVSTIGAAVYDKGGRIYHLLPSGGVQDCRQVGDGAMTGGSAHITSVSNPWTSADVNKGITIIGALAGGGLPSATGTITAFNNAGDVTVSFTNASGGSISGKVVTWGSDNGTAINALITLASAAGGGEVFIPAAKISGGVRNDFGLTTTIVPKSGVKLSGVWGASALRWVGAATTNMIYSGVPAAGTNFDRTSFAGLELDATHVNNVSGIYMNSWQNGRLDDVFIRGLAGAAPTAGIRIEANSGTAAVNNSAMNVGINVWISEAPIGMRFAAREGGGSAIYSTNNTFTGCYMQGISYAGIDLIQWCDSNWWQSLLIQISANNASGIIFNDSTTPNAFVGVYNTRVFGYSFDCNTVNSGNSPLVMNNTYENQIEGLYITGTPSTIVNDTNGGTNAGSYEVTYLTTVNNRMQRLSKGMDLDLAYTGATTATIKTGNLGSDTPPTNQGAIRILSAAAGTAYGGLEFEGSSFANGSGFLLAPADLGGGNVPFKILMRNNAAGWTEIAAFDTKGHIVSRLSGAPTSSNLGANVTSVTATGNDQIGKLAVVMSGALAANTRIATITFAASYGATSPYVRLTNETSGVGLAIVNPYVSAQSTGVSFDIMCNQALAAGTYAFGYYALGANTN